MLDNSKDVINVLVITTNRSKTILKTLKSIHKNNCSELVIKLYDFKSEDETVSVVKKFLSDNNLDWTYNILSFSLPECSDWQFALDDIEFGFVTFLEGDDYWPSNLILKVKSINREFPKIGLIHFSGHNKRKAISKNCKDEFVLGSDYRNYYSMDNLNNTHAPSQTFFKISPKTNHIKFEYVKYKYAPEPKFWLDISEFYNVYICNTLSIYRGISPNSNLKRQAIIDKFNYASELILLNRNKKTNILFGITYYLIRLYILVYLKKVFKGIERFDISVINNGLILYFKTFKKIINDK
jgi:glycosyltransferase involved in cell wall biosynthesis